MLVPFPLVLRARDVFCARRILLHALKRGEEGTYFPYSPGPLFNAQKIRTIIIVLAIAMRGGKINAWYCAALTRSGENTDHALYVMDIILYMYVYLCSPKLLLLRK